MGFGVGVRWGFVLNTTMSSHPRPLPVRFLGITPTSSDKAVDGIII